MQQLQFDKTKDFAEQPEEIQRNLVATYYACALLEPPLAMRQQVAAEEELTEEVTVAEANRKTVFDVFARPRLAEVSEDGYTIAAERIYIEQATSWRLHSETFTLSINQ